VQVSLGLWFLFSGHPVALSDLPKAASWLPWLMPTHYLFDGLLINIIDGQEYKNGLLAGPLSGDTILASVFSHDSSTLGKWENLAVVLGWALLLRVIHLCVTLSVHGGMHGLPVRDGPKGANASAPSRQQLVAGAPSAGAASHTSLPASQAAGVLHADGRSAGVTADQPHGAPLNGRGEEEQFFKGGIRPRVSASQLSSKPHSPGSPRRNIVSGTRILVEHIREQKHNSEEAVLLRLAKEQRAQREATDRQKLMQRLEAARRTGRTNVTNDTLFHVTTDALAQRRGGAQLAPYRPSTAPRTRLAGTTELSG
jgi:hypothetical protein